MYLIESVLGRVDDPRWQRRLNGCAIDVVRLSQWDAQKNRLRRESSGGIPLAIALERGQSLHDGDILFWDAAAHLAVVCELVLCEVLALDLRGLRALPPLQLAVRALALGHALGNQHWPAVQNDGLVYVPVTVSRDVVRSVLKTHRFDDIPHRFLPGRTVAEHLGPELARQLFGGSEQHEHHHAPDHVHAAGARENSETHGHDGTHRRDDETCGHSEPRDHTADAYGHGHGEARAHGHGDTDVSGTGAGDQRVRPAHGQGGLLPQRDRTEAFFGQAEEASAVADLHDAGTHSHTPRAYGHGRPSHVEAPDHVTEARENSEKHDHDGTHRRDDETCGHSEARDHDAESSRVFRATPAARCAPSSASGTSGSGASS